MKTMNSPRSEELKLSPTESYRNLANTKINMLNSFKNTEERKYSNEDDDPLCYFGSFHLNAKQMIDEIDEVNENSYEYVKNLISIHDDFKKVKEKIQNIASSPFNFFIDLMLIEKSWNICLFNYINHSFFLEIIRFIKSDNTFSNKTRYFDILVKLKSSNFSFIKETEIFSNLESFLRLNKSISNSVNLLLKLKATNILLSHLISNFKLDVEKAYIKYSSKKSNKASFNSTTNSSFDQLAFEDLFKNVFQNSKHAAITEMYNLQFLSKNEKLKKENENDTDISVSSAITNKENHKNSQNKNNMSRQNSLSSSNYDNIYLSGSSIKEMTFEIEKFNKKGISLVDNLKLLLSENSSIAVKLFKLINDEISNQTKQCYQICLKNIKPSADLEYFKAKLREKYSIKLPNFSSVKDWISVNYWKNVNKNIVKIKTLMNFDFLENIFDNFQNKSVIIKEKLTKSINVNYSLVNLALLDKINKIKQNVNLGKLKLNQILYEEDGTIKIHKNINLTQKAVYAILSKSYEKIENIYKKIKVASTNKYRSFLTLVV